MAAPSGNQDPAWWIADKIEGRNLVGLRHKKVVRLRRFFKADAKAEGSSVSVGGLESANENAPFSEAKWCAVELFSRVSTMGTR